MDFIDDVMKMLVLIPGKEQQCRDTKGTRHLQRQNAVLPLAEAPQPADQAQRRNQIVPVMNDHAAAEYGQPNKQIVLVRGKKQRLQGKRGKHTRTQLLHSMKDGRPGSEPVLTGVPREIVQFFRIHIGTGRVEKRTGRQACKILLAGLQLISPQHAHGFISPVQRAGVALS